MNGVRLSICVCVTIISELLTLRNLYALDDDGRRPIRDVTPPGIIRVYRDVEGKSFLKDASWFTNVRIDNSGNLVAAGLTLKLQGISLPERRKICKSTTGARWTCGNQAFMALRNFIGNGPVACEIKDTPASKVAICWVEGVDVARWLLEEGWAELADGTIEKTYVLATKLGQARKAGLWSK